MIYKEPDCDCWMFPRLSDGICTKCSLNKIENRKFLEKAIPEFLANGGVIEQLPTMPARGVIVLDHRIAVY